MFQTTILFTVYDCLRAVDEVLFTVGLWGIFRKCGAGRFWAIVPGIRIAKLGACANRDHDGRYMAILRILDVFLAVISRIAQNRVPFQVMELSEAVSDSYEVLVMIRIMLWFVGVIYSVRVYDGLCDIFDRNPNRVVLWLLVPGIMAVRWGFDKVLPEITVPERREKTAKVGLIGLKESKEAEEKGLDINIREVAVYESLSKKRLLQDVRLHVPMGRMVLLLGGSGAGKTTFVNAVTGYEKGTARILLEGKNVYTDFDGMKYRVGYVPQKDLMRDFDTVRHTLEDTARLRLPSSMSYAERQEKVDEAMRVLGITKTADTYVGKLSGGQRKRVSIAMEYLASPQLFILDEPDSGLDGVIARELMLRLRWIADEGRIVMVITHTPDRVADLFDDVIVLAKDGNRTGRLAYYGPVKEAKTFFGRDSMEDIVLSINRKEEGGEGMADAFIEKYLDTRRMQAGPGMA